jgi:hypothetical protein
MLAGLEIVALACAALSVALCLSGVVLAPYCLDRASSRGFENTTCRASAKDLP